MVDIEQSEDNHIDDYVDDIIFNCMNLNNPKSFFLFAGAGSGKTRSLVSVLNRFRTENYKQLQLNGQRVAIITYTNAACEEIERRLNFDPLFAVSTIHTFIWGLIKGFNKDIRECLFSSLNNQIEDLKLKQTKGRVGTKSFVERQKSIENKGQRVHNLENIKQFTYNPNGLNQGKESLSHTEVISIGAYFLTNKPLMQKILIKKFPILLIDESQDTNKELINALFEVEKKNNNAFLLGLFGDTMQRIYSDGKVDLGINLPESWSKPVKKMNHRCPPRIIKLINKIRSAVDDQEQKARLDKDEGVVRFFILPSTTEKANAEKKVVKRMVEITGDRQWDGNDTDYTTLILEHHMAANRLGFLEMFQPLYQMEKLKTGLLDGSLSGIKFFTKIILPIINANEIGDKFAITSIVRKYSPLLKIQKNETEQLLKIKNAQDAINQLLSLWDEYNEPRCIDVLQCVATLNLFDIPVSLYPLTTLDIEDQTVNDDNNFDGDNDVINAWAECLNAPFSQIRAYDSYITG
ncbi:UvrD-helicase domain-containing protein [Peribacillus frigoritolerans]|uniref:UvrD-helicase domain-containing protein n=1 Tax=Peribacillus frigoritolerans TaxID=450367 RepID=UPI003D268EEF